MAQLRDNVDVGSLSQIAPFSIGVLGSHQAPMPADQWQNSERGVLIDLLRDLPSDSGSTVINDLLHRILLSGGDLPSGGDPDNHLAQLRLAGTYNSGKLHETGEIAARSPRGYHDPQTALFAVNTLLALGQPEPACTIANQLSEARSAPFWLKIRAFCMAKAGNMTGAELIAGLVVEADPENAGFLKRINRLTTSPAQPETVQVQTALELALVEAAGDMVSSDELPFVLQAALAERDGEQSLHFAFESFVTGAISVPNMAELLVAHAAQLEVPVKTNSDTDDIQPQSPFEQDLQRLKWAKSRTGLDQLALLFSLGRSANDANLRADALAVLLQPENNLRQWLALHRLAIEEIRYLPLDQNLVQVAPVFIRASLLAGDFELASNWSKIIEPEMLTAWAFDLPFRMANPTTGSIKNTVLLEKDSEKKQFQLASDLMALHALDHQLDPTTRQWLSSHANAEEAQCPLGKQIALTSSAKTGAIAETILRIADLMGDSGFDGLPNSCNTRIVSALQELGLSHEARLAALEWTISNRFHK